MENKTKNIMILNKKELQELIAINTTLQPKAKTSNDLLLKLLECDYCDFEFVSVECTKTKGFTMVNRGSLAEILIKIIIKSYVKGDTIKGVSQRAKNGFNDLNTYKLDVEMLQDLGLVKTTNYEIKFSTGFAYASELRKNTQKIILLTPTGFYLNTPKTLIYDKVGHIKSQCNGLPIKALNELIGF